eukprot:TRINITY_DN6512_c0_g1_i2.p1 TRINITY_DN6512_c0_g1~~TRINITY_DN6512_c0_g1_i2.p1  ORF type:complete len:157 (-),score=25.52 TRINITY_DN6512_c0_g1_i2:60-530(-)
MSGCICDSAPPYTDNLVEVYTRGFIAAVFGLLGITHHDPVQGNLPIYRHRIFTPILHKFFSWYLKLPKMAKNYADVERYILQAKPKIPHLFLYSEADRLIEPHSIQKYIQLLIEHGYITKEKIFKDSPHVAHYKVYPKEYTDQVLSFLRYCKDKFK